MYHFDQGRREVTVRAKIGDDIVVIYCASKNRDAYADMEQRGIAVYAGYGTYYSYNGVLATGEDNWYHFWIKPH